jgi:hypothetical protein
VQSYDILLNVVSFAYGKYAIRQKMKVTGNQIVSETKTECPMENYAKHIKKVPVGSCRQEL